MSESSPHGEAVERPTTFGHFTLLRSMRPGGMGSVAVAYDSQEKDIVVVKRLPSEKRNNSDAVARFTDEINISLRLSHPNLARAVRWGKIAGEPYLCLEWVAGHDALSLATRAAEHASFLPLPVALAVGRQLCCGLEYAHARLNFVHRDVSPGNVMVGYDGGVRLVDYGLALSSMKSLQTKHGVVAGTASVLAPEQLEGRADARSDLYSLGCVLWYLLTGAPVMVRGEDDATRAELCERFARFRDEAPPELALFMWRAL